MQRYILRAYLSELPDEAPHAEHVIEASDMMDASDKARAYLQPHHKRITIDLIEPDEEAFRLDESELGGSGRLG